MGNLRGLIARLARLEARKGGGSPNRGGSKVSPTADRVYVLHVDAWATGGSLEDIP